MKKISKYKICGLLGRGGMGKVYKIEYPVIGKIAALKLLEPNPFLVDLIGMDTIKDLFISEAVIIAKLRHHNIVDILDFDEIDGKPFYIMNYYHNNLSNIIGETYETEKSSRVIPIEQAIHYIRQILEGVASLHYVGIIHRDIKPFNILLTDYDSVKICDFGLSKLRGEFFKGPESLKVGSPWYAAPEQEKDPDKADFNADLYSVGIILYRMLTGFLPLKDSLLPSQVNLDLDNSWDDFILKAINVDPTKRFLTAKQMLMGLNKLHINWLTKKEKICSIPESFLNQLNVTKSNQEKLRSKPMKVSIKDAKKVFGLDELWRPLICEENDFELNDVKKIVIDKTTNLIWQQASSQYPMTWRQADKHIETLNKNRFAGYENWRLPSSDELISLLSQTPHGQDYCLKPVFEQDKLSLWTCDKCTYISAWYVNVNMGFISWQDFEAYNYVKGVCDLKGTATP